RLQDRDSWRRVGRPQRGWGRGRRGNRRPGGWGSPRSCRGPRALRRLRSRLRLRSRPRYWRCWNGRPRGGRFFPLLCTALTQAVDLGQKTVDVVSAVALERGGGAIGKPLPRAAADGLGVVLLGAQHVRQHPDDEEDYEHYDRYAAHL